jgi:hypothetical protein
MPVPHAGHASAARTRARRREDSRLAAGFFMSRAIDRPISLMMNYAYGESSDPLANRWPIRARG